MIPITAAGNRAVIIYDYHKYFIPAMRTNADYSVSMLITVSADDYGAWSCSPGGAGPCIFREAGHSPWQILALIYVANLQFFDRPVRLTKFDDTTASREMLEYALPARRQAVEQHSVGDISGSYPDYLQTGQM